MKTMALASAASKGSKGWPARSRAVKAEGEGWTVFDAGSALPVESLHSQPETRSDSAKANAANGIRRNASVLELVIHTDHEAGAGAFRFCKMASTIFLVKSGFSARAFC